MPVDITIPSPGESVTKVTLGPWHKSDGDWVEKDDTLVEIESDKVTLEVPAPESGVLKISAQEGEEKEVGDTIGSIDSEAEKPADRADEEAAGTDQTEPAGAEKEAEAEGGKEKTKTKTKADGEEETSKDATRNEIATATAASSGAGGESNGQARATSLAKKIAEERGVDLARIKGTGPGGRITKTDVVNFKAPGREKAGAEDVHVMAERPGGTRGSRREKMTKLRRRIAQRLVDAQHNAAMLTTFNEVDMTAVMAMRKRYKDAFSEKHGVGLGFMSFFAKACTSALQAFPRVNAYIVGDEIEYHDYVDISVAVGTDKGLVVPVLRNVEIMSFADIEQGIKELATRARDGKLTIDEMTGGTFTISNGGVYGSLNSTPILNPPQSAILGMHKIMNRAVEHPERPGELALRPMMYLALSYDHRIIDGSEAVSFLVHVKDAIEQPERVLLGV